jgi:hypothetical protein
MSASAARYLILDQEPVAPGSCALLNRQCSPRNIVREPDRQLGAYGGPLMVRLGSLADILTSPRHVRFTPNDRRWAAHPSQRWPAPAPDVVGQVLLGEPEPDERSAKFNRPLE